MAYKQISPQVVAEGGTGLTTITDGGILLGSGTAAITPTAQPTNGQLIVGSTGVDPVLATITGDDGIDITNAGGSLTVGSQIVQIVSTMKSTGSSTSSTSFVDVTNGSLSITPTSSSNSILVWFNWLANLGNVASTNGQSFFNILRGATQLNTTGDIRNDGISSSGGDRHQAQRLYQYVDAPATTSATTYKIQHRVTNASFTLTTEEINMILIEVVP